MKLKETLSLFVLFSLVLHLFFYFGINNFKKADKPQEEAKPILVELDVRSMEPESKMRQIVDQDEKKLNDETDEEAKYLGRHNQKVVKETKAAHSGAFSNAAQPGQRKAGSPEPTPDKNQKSKLSGDLPSLDKLKPQFSMTPKAESYQVQQEGLNSQTPDHLKDVDRGLQTMLSTREFVYFSYYQRIREKIRQQWEPRIRKKVHQVFASGRTIASSRDRITQVIIILDKSGSLENVQVIGESGVQDLDEAAVEAFKAAEPFPNPPAGIVEADGKIRIRWDFVLEAQYQNEIQPIRNVQSDNNQIL
jgi:protein TonB